MAALEGKRAVVTGGASGIGLATARRMIAEGARVCVLDRDKDALERARGDLSVLALEVDVAEPEALEAALLQADHELGRIDVLFNNAGEGRLAPLEQYDRKSFDRLLAVNLAGVFHAIRVVAPLMRGAGGGAIVNNASGSGVRPTSGEAPYAAAKAAVIALTKSAALEYGPEVRVNCVSPGIIRTAMTEPLFAAPGLLDPVERAMPLARAGTAEEVADVVLFLCSGASRYVTGQNLVVDGGLALPQAGIDPILRDLLAHMRGER